MAPFTQILYKPSQATLIVSAIAITCIAMLGSRLNWISGDASRTPDRDPIFDLPRPPIDLVYSRTSNIICMTVMTSFGLLAVLLGALDARRSRTPLPVVLPLSGAMIAFPETFIDVLGCIYYPWTDQNASFHILGREMPPWIPVWFGYGSLMQILLQLLSRKTSTRNLWWFLALMMISDLIVEEILLPMGVYAYYGNQPLVAINLFPWWWMVSNSVGVFLATALSYRYRQLLTGWRVLAVLFLTPMSVGGIYGFICFPVWAAINGDYGWFITQLLGLLTMVFGFIAFCLVLELVLERRPFDMEANGESCGKLSAEQDSQASVQYTDRD